MAVRSLLPLMLLAALPFAVLAGTPIDETRPLDARGSVDISNVKGRIQVRVWDKPQVHIGGTLGRGVERFDIDGEGDSLDIKVKYPNNSGNSEPTELIVDVPVLASLEVNGVSADIDITGTAGRTLEINSVSGGVSVAGAPGEADVNSVSGDLRLTLNSNDIKAQTVSGDIALSGRIKGEVSAETVSGNLGVDSKGERLRKVSSNTVSGNATLRVALADGGRIAAESVSGDITLSMPKSLSAQVGAKSFSGDLSAPGARIERPTHGPGASFEQRYGGGDGEIRLETFSGDATLELN